ncbi:hypothetical protein SDRG_10672 [Saprolegnia diclina VS20]|uniref:Uncharacterized protein n=1 Tax=Saprolegnia diclina (strain VS20) TaxID=1156394 RepID=T0RNF3_SAPDV|nr:hypothetical protein SDRG_10672 [Saprolegnia diclina VS20]EQC31497.1 hypothetical protein SDRG_10672 [Saprolegnia diclina VS20]|eukprot:XP_008614896.1 hypothetical protein SDRG_10672 [Saprolegnia diclina VS20]
MPAGAMKKRVLTKQQLETNRVRSKQYYEDNRDSVLAKLRTYYSENREKERLRQRQKYMRMRARKLAAKAEGTVAPASPTPGAACRGPLSDPLSIAFLLN